MRVGYCLVLVTFVSSISGLSLDCAVNRTTGAPLATAVEGCVCPQGYKVIFLSLKKVKPFYFLG